MKKRILLVDDDKGFLRLEKAVLERQGGFEIHAARGGQEAMMMVADQRFDLIILDIMMPDVDGFTVCQMIRELPKGKEVPIIFLTAKSDSLSFLKGYDLGGTLYLNKPIKAGKLLRTVNQVLFGRETPPLEI